MKTLYLDIFSGISGDMFLGALIDLGVDFRQFEQELAKLGLYGYHVHATQKQKASITGVKFDVHLEAEHHHHPGRDHEHSHDHDHESIRALGHDSGHSHHGPHSHDHHHHHLHEPEHAHENVPQAADHDESDHPHSHRHDHSDDRRDFGTIRTLITQSGLSDWVKEKSVAMFRRIAEAEGKIHGLPPDQVHFHEVGAIDSIVDIVGACIALEMLGRPRVLAAPVVEGTGWIECAHGRFPVPAPATLEIFQARGITVTQCDEAHELVTPTGAALLAELVEDFRLMPGLEILKVGYGLGTRDNRTRPNVLRVVLGSPSPRSAAASDRNDWESDTIMVLETNLDDCSAEILGHLQERALTAGALDVFYTPIQMKKNRPGSLVTILCDVSESDRFTELLLRETSAFGIRRYPAERRKLRRDFREVSTLHGPVTMKLGKLNGKILHATPEYESCRKLAAATNVPLKEIYESALRALPDKR